MDENFDYISRIVPATETLFVVPASVVVSYTGPGDIVSGAFGWWGLRAYTAASIGSNCVDIIRASDSTTQTFVTVSGGGVDIAGITAFLASTTGKISKLYDQSGSGLDLTEAVNQPAFTFNAVGSLPGMTFNGSVSLTSPSDGASINQPFTISGIAKRTSNTGSFADMFGSAHSKPQLGYGNSAGTALIYDGLVDTSVAITENVFNSIQGIFNGASSTLSINGSPSTVNPGTDSILVNENFMLGSGNNPLTGVILECGFWLSSFSGPNLTSMNANQHAYWGF